MFRRFSNSEDCSSEGRCFKLHFVVKEPSVTKKDLNGWAGTRAHHELFVFGRWLAGGCTVEELRETCVTCKGKNAMKFSTVLWQTRTFVHALYYATMHLVIRSYVS